MTPESILEVSTFVMEHYVDPVKERAEKALSITAGELQQQLGWGGRISEVCEILASHDFQFQTGLDLIGNVGPTNRINTQFRYKVFEGYPEGSSEA